MSILRVLARLTLYFSIFAIIAFTVVLAQGSRPVAEADRIAYGIAAVATLAIAAGARSLRSLLVVFVITIPIFVVSCAANFKWLGG